jgi:hypothetical protein
VFEGSGRYWQKFDTLKAKSDFINCIKFIEKIIIMMNGKRKATLDEINR